MQQQNADKLTEKAFIRLIVTSILGILICLVSLCSVTWAWFTGNITSTSNHISTAEQCLLSVSVADGENASLGTITANAHITSLDQAFPAMRLALSPGVVYQVTLTLPKDSGSGYCVMTVGENSYYTETLLAHQNNVDASVTFALKVTEATEVLFTPRWGIYSGEPDALNGLMLTVEVS